MTASGLHHLVFTTFTHSVGPDVAQAGFSPGVDFTKERHPTRSGSHVGLAIRTTPLPFRSLSSWPFFSSFPFVCPGQSCALSET